MRISHIIDLIAEDNRFLFTSVAILSLVLIWINFSIRSPILGGVIAPLYLFINGVFIGQVLFSDQSKVFKLFYGFLTIFSLILVLGDLAYWVLDFSNSSILVVLLLLTTTLAIFNKLNKKMGRCRVLRRFGVFSCIRCSQSRKGTYGRS